MKKVLLMALAAQAVFGTTVVVKKADVIVAVNKVQIMLEKDEDMSLYPNEEICFVKGKGKIIIDNKIKISSRSKKKCFTNKKDVKTTDLLTISVVYTDSSENTRAGTSRQLVLKK